jgi:hypothetical protein
MREISPDCFRAGFFLESLHIRRTFINLSEISLAQHIQTLTNYPAFADEHMAGYKRDLHLSELLVKGKIDMY